MSAEGDRVMEFFIKRTDRNDPELTSALKMEFPADKEYNILVFSYYKEAQDRYRLIYMIDCTGLEIIDGEEHRVASMEANTMVFVTVSNDTGKFCFKVGDVSGSIGDRYAGSIAYTDQSRRLVLRQSYGANENIRQEAVWRMLDDFNDIADAYDFTVLYSYINGEEVINTKVDTLPEFSFPLFDEYACTKP